MKSRGIDGSLTILPAVLAGRPVDRLTEVIGVLLEQQGLENIELGQMPFVPPAGTPMNAVIDSLAGSLRKRPVTTEYVLYAEFNGSRETGLTELRAVVLDSTGNAVWTDTQGPNDEAMKKMELKEPMTFSVLLVENLSPMLGLNEETAKAAKPGKLTRLMEERSGLPPESERSLLPGREKLFKESGQKAKLTVYPVRIGGEVNRESAGRLSKMINDAGLCSSVPASGSPLLTASQAGPDELKILWDLAREFREYCRKNPSGAGYAIYADYAFNPDQWEQGYVHFVVCDRSGEWVIVDLQNSHQDEYKSVKPKSIDDCSRLLVQRLRRYMQ